MFVTRVRRGRRVRFEVEVEIEVSGFRREKLLFTGTEITTGWVREVEEVIVLDEEWERKVCEWKKKDGM